jgi:hypothetical protein
MLLFVVLFFSINTVAQKFDLAFSASQGGFATALSWFRLHSLGKKDRFNIGYGVRFTTVFHNKLDFITAPAKFTSDVANLDTLQINQGNINALNASIHLQYNLSSKFEAGFNIDALGFSFGKKQTGTYTSSIYTAGKVTTQAAKITPFNLLLIGDNDTGSLNSEFYVRYWISSKVAVRAGATFLFTEYTTDKKLSLDNDRFRNKSWQALLAVTFNPFKK